MPIGIYPPTLKSTQSAFIADTQIYPIYFTLQSVTSKDDIGNVQIRVVRQSNNKSIVNTELYPDGVIYKPASKIDIASSTQYFIQIERDTDLSEKWEEGVLYKIQMRFGTSALYNSLSEFATWKKTQVSNETFSEWSTVMLIKAIAKPDVSLKNTENTKQDVTSTTKLESTQTPLFTGSYSISDNSKETVDKYKFDLYKGKEEDIANLIETTGWLQHDGGRDQDGVSYDSHRFKNILTNGETYSVIYSISTINGYETSAQIYTFQVTKTYLQDLEDVEIVVDSTSEYCRENGCIRIYCSSGGNAMTGNYVITRTDERSNYGVWEDISYLAYFNHKMSDELIFTDFTIESGIRYKYAFQLENAKSLRSSPVYPTPNAAHSIDFEWTYLYCNGIQLKLSLSTKLSSFKHTTLRSKQDTLSSQYPYLVQNGKAYYAEFPISAMISYQMDEDQTFFTVQSDGLYYDGELVIPKDKFGLIETTRNYDESVSYKIDSSQASDNVFIERVFREKAESFLNNFEAKLYRSPTEGNIIVNLMNISLAPDEGLSRMIATFSATAYEVAENTIENLNEYGIISIGEYQSLASEEVTKSFGQISGIYGSNIDVYDLIRQQEEVSVGGGYKMQLKQVSSIWVELYPDVDLTAYKLEQKALISEAEGNGEDYSEYQTKWEEYDNLEKAMSNMYTTTILSVNGAKVMVLPNKVYSLEHDISLLTVTTAVYPVIINYICDLVQVEDTSVGVVTSIDTSKIWGQISGIFTGTHKNLSAYNWDYANSENSRVYSRTEAMKIRDSEGNLIVDNTTYNVYKTQNLLDIIKEDTQHQVEIIYDNTHFEEVNGELTDGTLYYVFGYIYKFDIEADEGTTLYIGKKADGSDAEIYRIGPTCRYVLDELEGQVKYIALEEPQHCIINYICMTNQTTIERQ